jgi:hypothetical protein
MVLARSVAPFSASITDFLRPVYYFDGMCLVLCYQHDEHTYNACLERFYMWVQHIVCSMVVEVEKKDQIHDQNGGELSRYLSSKDICNRQNGSRVLSPRWRSRWSAPPPVALGLRGGSRSLAGGGFTFFV